MLLFLKYVWEQRKLGDLATIKGRLGWKSLKQEEYTDNKNDPAMIAGRHIRSGCINWNLVDHIPMWRYEESLEIALQNGDVIFSKDGSLGNPAIIKELDKKATINSTMMLVRTNDAINSNFFYQLMTGDQFQKLVYLKVSGSSIPHLFQDDMKKFVFKAPLKVEQDQISHFLDILDSLIAANQRQQKKPWIRGPPWLISIILYQACQMLHHFIIILVF
ncbi:restriction endonuclease subunit S [Pediococcus ethanolidurans]|uniref:restriction endonuclease subunit S n=1 Tax=Pediococcus ethanolidurans TaxID=319653 RepID=UPI002953891F|nr:restriction endonuclease subunit S [Pediococcus ethanolidurans]